MQSTTNPYGALRGSSETADSSAPPPGPFPSAEPFIIQRERAILADLGQLVAERAAVEPRIDVDFKKQFHEEQEAFDAEYQEIITRFAAEKESLEREF